MQDWNWIAKYNSPLVSVEYEDLELFSVECHLWKYCYNFNFLKRPATNKEF